TKGVADLVKPEQMTRLKQIQRQQQRLQVFADAEVQKSLNLTDDQKDEIKKLGDASREKMRDIFQDAQGDREKMRTEITKLNNENTEKVNKLLKEGQQKALKELLGKPFEIKLEPGRRP